MTEVSQFAQIVAETSSGIVGSRTVTDIIDYYLANNLIQESTFTTTDRVRTTNTTTTTTTTRFETTNTFTDLFFEKREGGLEGYDLEFGYKLPLKNTLPEVRVFGGYYDFDGPFDSEIKGVKGRLEVRAGEYFTFDAEVFEDEELHGSDYFFGARVNLPFSMTNLFSGKNPFLIGKNEMVAYRSRGLSERLDEEVIRDVEVQVAESNFVENLAKRNQTFEQNVVEEVDVQVVTESSERDVVSVAQRNETYSVNGDDLTFTHVDNTDAGSDDGTFENPNQSLTAANATQAADANDIILLHSDSSFDGESVDVTDNQMLIGQGGGIDTTVSTDQGDVVLPEANPTGSSAPVITNGNVDINSNNVVVTNVVLDGGSIQTAAGGDHSNLTITNVTVSNSAGNAISLGAGGGTLDGNIVLENITITNSSDDSIELDNLQGSAVVNGQNILITDAGDDGLDIDDSLLGAQGMFSDITISGGDDNGIDLDGDAGTFTFTDTSITGVADDGLRINDSSGNYTFDNLTIDGSGDDGVDIDDSSGTFTFNNLDVSTSGEDGIDLDSNSGTFTFDSNSSVTTSDDDAVEVSGGSADITYSGTIDHSGAGHAIDLNFNSGGDIVFNSAANDAIMSDSDGIFVFNSSANLTVNADAELTGNGGVQIVFSDGVYIFDDTDIVDVLGFGLGALDIFDSNATITFGANSSITQGVGLAAVSVTATDSSTLDFNGTIGATAGAGILIDTVDGDYAFHGPITLADTGGINITDTGAAGSVAFNDVVTVNNATGAGINLTGNAGSVDFNAVTNVNNAATDGINLDNNATGSVSFADVNIDLSANNSATGINYGATSNGGADFANVVITDVGTGTNQVGIDFNGADLSGQQSYTSVDISGDDTSTDSIAVDLTGVTGNQIVHLGEQVRAGASSHISDVHRGVVIDPTASIQFVFGDGENVTDTGSTIDVNGLAGSFTVDAGGGTLAASSFNFEDVVVGAGDEANLPLAANQPVFVSTAGGAIAEGVNNLIISGSGASVNTITVAAALGQANTGQHFVFVGDGMSSIDVTGGGVVGFSLLSGQSISSFDNGNVIFAGSQQPLNITGNIGAVGANYSSNDVIASNTAAAATSVIAATDPGGNNQISNLSILGPVGANASIIIGSAAGVPDPVTLANLSIDNGTDTAILLDGNTQDVTLMNVDLVDLVVPPTFPPDPPGIPTAANTGTALEVIGGSHAGQITVGSGSDLGNTTGTVLDVNVTDNIVNLDMSAAGIDTANNTSNVVNINGLAAGSNIQLGNIVADGVTADHVVNIDNMTGGTVTVREVAITNFGDSNTDTAIDIAGAGGAVNFTEVDISTTTGNALAVGGQTLAITNTDNNIVANSGQALSFAGTAFDAAGVTFNQVTSNMSAAEGININGTSGGTFTITSIDIDNSGTNGIALTNAAGNVVIEGGSIDTATLHSMLIDGGSADVTFRGDITHSTAGGAAVFVTGGHTGTVGFGTGAISSSLGSGLQFDNADGIYNFNTMSGSTSLNGGDAGIDILNGSAGTFTFTDSTINNTAGGIGINIDNGGAAAGVTFNGLDVTTNNNAGIVIANNTGTITIDNSVDGTSIDATGGSAFDATGVNLDVTFDEVDANSGASDGIDLNTTTGTFTVGSAAGAAGSGGTIAATGGNGVNITGGSVAATFNSMNIDATGGTGININGGTTGDITFQNSDIRQLGTGGLFNIDGSTAGNILFDANGSLSASVAGNTGGVINNTNANVTIANLTLANTGGTEAVNITGGTGQFQFDNASITNATGVGIDVNNHNGLFRFRNGLIDGTGGNVSTIGLDIDGGTGNVEILRDQGLPADSFTNLTLDAINVANRSGTITLSDIDASNIGGDILDVTTSGAVTITNGLTLANLAVSGSGSANFINQTGTIDATGVVMSNLVISGGNADFNFDATSQLINTNNNATIDISNHSGGTVDFLGTISATNGSGLLFDNADGTYNFGGTVTLNGGDAGIDIVTGSAGTFTFTDTDITSPSGAAVTIDGSTTDVTFGAASTIVQNNAASAILINGNSGGTINFNGSITANTSTATGVNLTSNTGAAINFNGDLDIDTTSGTGFSATGGGTVGVAAAGTTTVDTSGTGGAINIDSVTVAAGGVNFDQVTTANAATVDGVEIVDATGGTITLATVDLNGTAGTIGLDIVGNSRTSNVVVTGGSINSGARISGSGTGTVTVGANTTDNAGYAFQVANRGAGAGDVNVNGTVTNNTGAVSIQNNSAGTVNFNGVVTGTGANTAGAIDIDINTGGTTNFTALVDIDVTGNGTGVMIGNTNTAAALVNFNGGLDISSVDGIGFNAEGATVGVMDAGTEQVVATGTAGAINIDGATVAAGGITFDQVTTAATATSAGIDINDASGGTLTFTSVDLNGTAGTTGLDVSGNSRTSNVVVSGGTINSGVRIQNSGTGTVTIDANTTDNAGHAVQVANRGAGAGQVDINGTVTNNTGAVSIASNSAGTVNFNGVVTGTGTNNAGAIDIDNNTGGATNFTALVDIDVTGNGTGVMIGNTNTAAAAINFNAGLDINSVNGIGFNAEGGTVGVADAATESVVVTGTAGAINIDGATVAAGGITFDQVTTAATATSAGIDINDASGGTLTFTSVDLNGTAGTTGLDVSGNSRTSNVVVSGGTINSGVRIQNSGTGTVTIDANTTDNAGHAVQVANRGAGAGQVDINGTVTNNTGAVSIASNSAGTVNFNGVVTGTGTNNAGAIDIDNNTGGATNFTALVDIDVTGSGTGVMIGATNTAGAAINFNGGLDISTVNGTGFNAEGGTVGVADAGTEQIATSGTGAAINIDGATAAAGGIHFDSVTSTAATAAGSAININDNSGGTINIGTASLTGPGVDISGTVGAAISFTDLDIALNGDNQTAFDLSNAVLNAGISAGDFDVTSSSATGTTGISLVGTTGAGVVQLGDTTENGGADATIAGVNDGVLFSSTTNIDFTFGDGSNTMPDGIQSSINAVTPINDNGTGLPAGGSYDFNDVTLTGDTSALAGPDVYYVDAAGAGTGATQTNAGSIADAEASGADAIVLIDTTTDMTADTIDQSMAPHISGGAISSLELADGQVLVSLINGQMIDLGLFGLMGGAPMSFETNVGGSSTITGEATLDNMHSVLTTNSGDTVVLNGSGVVQGVTITNTGTGNGLSFSVGATAAELNLASNTITGGSAGAGIFIDGSSGAGTVTITNFADNTIVDAGASGINITDVTFDADTGTMAIEQVSGGNTVVGTIGNRVTGDGIRLNDVLGDIAFGTLNIFNDTGTGLFVRDNGGKGGTFAISNTGGIIDTTNGTAMDIDPVMADFTFGTVSSTNANGQGSSAATAGGVFLDGVDAQGGAASNAVTINNLSVTGSTDAGINLNNSTGTFTFGNTNINNAASAGGGVDINNSATDTATVNFNTGLVVATGAGTGIDAVVAAGGSVTLNVTNAATETISTVSGTAINLDGVTAGATFDSVTATALNGNNGIDLTNVSGILTANGGSLTSTGAGDVVTINGAAPSFDMQYFANITQNGTGALLSVTNTSADTFFNAATATNGTGLLLNNSNGTHSFNGNVTLNTGTNTAITMINAGNGGVLFGAIGTVNVDIDTTTANAVDISGDGVLTFHNSGTSTINTTSGAGFQADGGGTVFVGGAGTLATIATTTGTAVDIQNIAISSFGVAFESVSASGATNGIVLNNTGVGAFSVTGDGTSGGTLDANNNGSGGTITGTTGDAISLTNTGPVTIRQMDIGGAGALGNIDGSGIRASGVNGLTVANTDFRNVADQNSPDEAAIFISNAVAGSSITLSNNLFNRSFDDHVRIENSSAVLGTITINDNFFNDNVASGMGNDAFLYVGDNGSNATINVTGNSFLNSAGDHIQVALNGSASATVNIGGANLADGNTFNANTAVLGSGITFSSGASGGGFSGTLNYLVQNNTINNASAGSINVNMSATSTDSAVYSGTIADNVIGTAGDFDSGGFGIQISGNGAGTLNANITNNTVREHDGDFGLIISGDEGTGRVNANVSGNTFTHTDPAGTGFGVIGVNAGAVAGDAFTVCADIENNTFAGQAPAMGFGTDFFIFEFNGNNTIILPGYAGGATDGAAITAFIQGQNVGVPTGTSIVSAPGQVIGTGTACP